MKYVSLLCLLIFACTTEQEPALMFEGAQLVDLAYAFDDETVFWPTADGFSLSANAKGWQEAGYYYEANSFATAEHGGTHLDAPIHFAEGAWTNEAIPLERLMGAAVVVDVSDKALADRDYQIATEDIQAWEAEHGALPDGVILLFRTGYGQYWPDRDRYMGTSDRGAEAIPKLHFPGISPGAARWLVENRTVHAVGLDTPSIDYGQSASIETHTVLFAANIPAFENVANLDQLPPSGFAVVALPMKIRGGSGGPLRIVAILPGS